MSLASLDFAFSGLLVDARLKLFDLELARLRQLADTPAPTISAGALPPEADLHQLRELEQRQFEAERAQLQAQLTQLEQAAGDQAQEEQRLHQQLHHAHFTHAVLNSLVTAHESRLSTVGRPESVALEGACVRAAALLDQARQTHRDLASQVERETLAGQEEEANPQLIVQRTEKSVRRKQVSAEASDQRRMGVEATRECHSHRESMPPLVHS